MYNLKNTSFFLSLVFIALFCLYGPLASGAYALDVTGIRFGQHGTATRIVLDLDQEADFRATVQENPNRAVIDLPMLSGKPLIGRSVLPGLIRDIRLEPLSGSYSRLSFLMTGTATIRSAFLMPAEGKMPTRLVLDLSPSGSEVFAKHIGRPNGTLQISGENVQKSGLPFATGTAGIKLDPVGGPKAPTVNTPAAPKGPDKIIPEDLPLIMIDPGHGGQDSGAVGNGVSEKVVTLGVANALAKALRDTGRYRVALTRDKDIFIRLGDRVRIARSADADLFVSIHADSVATGGTAVQGASFYTLSAQASDAQSARLAARENQADLLAGVELPTDDQEVKEILIDLAMRDTTHRSKAFAGILAKSFRSNGIKTVPGAQRSAGFMVLKAPDIPSVLVELGFLSNPVEAAKLGREDYRAGLADTIAGGIDAYFSRKKL